MINAKDAVVWINDETKEVMVRTNAWGRPEKHQGFSRGVWGDPIGAAYLAWDKMTNKERVHLMLETVIELGMRGFPLKETLSAFAGVREFRALGSESYPMCRALTSALVDQCLEAHTMSFKELLEYYRPKELS
jgi:hypothetical protein